VKNKIYAHPLKVFANTEFENIIWNLVVSMISGVLAFSSYNASLGLLFFPMLAVFCITIFSIFIDVFFALKAKLTKG